MRNLAVNTHSEWKDVTPYVNVDDVWFSCKAVYVNVNHEWHKVYHRTADIIPFPTRRYQGVLQDVRISAA